MEDLINKISNLSINEKGYNCSLKGKEYELQVYNIVSNCKLNDKLFNTQDKSELGGCSSRNDIECNLYKEKDISIEIKKYNSPDWMQCTIKYDIKKNKWFCCLKNKASKIFEKLISNIKLFNDKIPPFIFNNITYEEWLKIKCDFNDIYIDCPNDTIKRLYKKKGCNYIQISNKGLYHLGDDKCNFDVPEFICEQRLRIRVKIHKKTNNKGFCNLSVTIACQPKKIKELENSKYTLDNSINLPQNLIFTLK